VVLVLVVPTAWEDGESAVLQGDAEPPHPPCGHLLTHGGEGQDPGLRAIRGCVGGGW